MLLKMIGYRAINEMNRISHLAMGCKAYFAEIHSTVKNNHLNSRSAAPYRCRFNRKSTENIHEFIQAKIKSV